MKSHVFALVLLLLLGLGCQKKAASGGAPVGFATQAVVTEAKVQALSESLSLVGSVAANEMVEIKSETEGTVERIEFTEGQKVAQGDLLVRLDDTKLGAATAEAEANFKLSRANYDRGKRLFEEKLISQQDFDQMAAQFQANEAGLELKRRQLKDTRIYAPFAGVISARSISPGQVISKDTSLTWLVDLDPVKVEFNVPERFVSRLRLGQKIRLTVAAYPGRDFAGEVFFVAPFVEAATRSALVKARALNPDGALKPGMFANLDLTLRLKEQAVVIPEAAVLASGDRTVIYVVDSDDNAQLRPVKLGIRQAGVVEVLTGLQAGERLVAEGLQKVRPGGKVKASAPAPATAGPGLSAPEGGKAGTRESGDGTRDVADRDPGSKATTVK